MIGFDVRPYTFNELNAMASPETVNAGETIPHVLYSRRTYVNATTRSLDFFADNPASPFDGNVNGGQLTNPNWFLVHNLMFDIGIIPAVVVTSIAAGPLVDFYNFLIGQWAVFTLTLSDKKYGPYPLSLLHCTGGQYGVGWGTVGATHSVQSATNSVPDGGWDWCGAIVIPPNVGWKMTLEWEAPITLSDAANKLMRVALAGELTRRVL